ncbi:MAG TPA: flagellar hook 2 domain-containing protein [Janthinobacterium sp.]|nr:flagellar hook 2 domain-containing protein [Janthinobacterium sp.]
MVTSAVNNSSATQATPSADVYARVEQIMTSQNKGATKLNASLTRDQTKLSALGQLQNILTQFQSVAQGVGGAGLATSATSSAPAVLGATSSGQAVGGSYALNVTRLAQGQALAGAVQKSASAAIGTGAATVIKVEFGTGEGKNFAAGKTSKTITIDSGNNSLQGIAAAFKAAGVDATVVQSGSGFALALKGATGAANSMRISGSGDTAVKDLLSYDTAASAKSGLSQVAAAQDAQLTVDGKALTSASNTLTTAIAGTTLTLSGIGAAKVVVAKDASQIASNVAGLVAAYNSLNAKLQTLQTGDLKADTALGQVGTQLAQVLQGTGADATALANAGISVGKNGNMVLDDKKLKAAIAADPDAVGKLFTNNGSGIADRFAAKLTSLNGDSGGIHRETAALGKDIGGLNVKRAALTKALTAQANALVKMYSQQEQSGATGGASSLFDFMA